MNILNSSYKINFKKISFEIFLISLMEDIDTRNYVLIPINYFIDCLIYFIKKKIEKTIYIKLFYNQQSFPNQHYTYSLMCIKFQIFRRRLFFKKITI